MFRRISRFSVRKRERKENISVKKILMKINVECIRVIASTGARNYSYEQNTKRCISILEKRIDEIEITSGSITVGKLKLL